MNIEDVLRLGAFNDAEAGPRVSRAAEVALVLEVGTGVEVGELAGTAADASRPGIGHKCPLRLAAAVFVFDVCVKSRVTQVVLPTAAQERPSLRVCFGPALAFQTSAGGVFLQRLRRNVFEIVHFILK